MIYLFLVTIYVLGCFGFDTSFQVAEISNCTCDITPLKCDTFCCCDQDCDQIAVNSFNFSCVPGLRGGQDDGKHLAFNCSRNSSNYDSPFHNLLCIQHDNSAYLGDYFTEFYKIETQYHYDQLEMKKNCEQHSYEEARDWKNIENSTDHYKVGVPIKTLYDRFEGVLGSLSLPSNSLHGGCVPGPVRFLKPSYSVCNQPINQDICMKAKNTYLDHQMYIMSSAVIAKEPNFPQVLSENNYLKTAPTETHYYITNNIDHYLNVDKGQDRNQYTSSEDFSFLKKKIDEASGFDDSLFGDPDYSPYDKVHSVAHLNPEPGSVSCNNLVLEVNYQIFWSGLQIAKIRADLLLGNFSLTELQKKKNNISIKQYFKTTFIHTSQENSISRAQTRRSGNPGYVNGSPLIFAKKIKTAEESFYEQDDNGFKIWGDNGVNSLCRDNNLSRAYFGKNVLSGCFITLTKDQFDKCAEITTNVLKIQRSLIKSGHVARGGDLNLTQAENIVKIISENPENVPMSNDENDLFPTCIVPSKLKITVLTTSINENMGPIAKINGLKVSTVSEKWDWKCKTKVRGSKSCDEAQKFFLATELEFLEIPNVWHHQNTSRFWLKQDSMRCEGDICWEDLLLPLGTLIQGDAIAEVLEWTLAFSLLLPPTFYFSRLKI